MPRPWFKKYILILRILDQDVFTVLEMIHQLPTNFQTLISFPYMSPKIAIFKL